MFSASRNSLIVYQILAHIAFVSMCVFGTTTEWAISIGIYFLLATVGGTVTYHRLLSHKSFKAPKWFEYLGSILGAIGGNGSGIAWAAIHREHHRFTDTEKDPHSPLYKSFFRVQFLSMCELPSIKYVPDLIRSKFHMWIHTNYWILNAVYAGLVMLVDPFAVVYAYLVPTLLVWHAGSAINTINHVIGYRTTETKEFSTNNIFTGYLVSGEGWHNNHHSAPADPQFGKKWWEFDLGWQVIKLVQINAT
jgi:stearoyl-CoA desaturase (delta-9 desaturase)